MIEYLLGRAEGLIGDLKTIARREFKRGIKNHVISMHLVFQIRLIV